MTFHYFCGFSRCITGCILRTDKIVFPAESFVKVSTEPTITYNCIIKKNKLTCIILIFKTSALFCFWIFHIYKNFLFSICLRYEKINLNEKYLSIQLCASTPFLWKKNLQFHVFSPLGELESNWILSNLSFWFFPFR